MSVLTDEERKAIDEYEGEITRDVTMGSTKTSRANQIDLVSLRAEYEVLVNRHLSATQIAEERGVTTPTVYRHLKLLGMTLTQGGRRPAVDKARMKRVRSIKKGREVVRDRRRFKHAPVPIGNAKSTIQPGSDADVNARTIFPNKRLPVSGRAPHITILKDGAHNSKIGGDVLVGDLKGAKIFTLTLEERATCPRTCQHWLSCYGNADQHASRWEHGSEFERELMEEVSSLCSTYPAVLIRLHYLGDFYSMAYVDLWHHLLGRHENLHCFGFTAHHPQSEIGDNVNSVREEFGFRFSIRHSGTCDLWGSFTIDFPTERSRIGNAIVCPEQRDAMNDGSRMKHCGNCALCWQAPEAIVFVEH